MGETDECVSCNVSTISSCNIDLLTNLSPDASTQYSTEQSILDVFFDNYVSTRRVDHDRTVEAVKVKPTRIARKRKSNISVVDKLENDDKLLSSKGIEDITAVVIQKDCVPLDSSTPIYTIGDALSQPDLQVSQKKSNGKITRSRKRRALSAATFDIATPPTYTTEDVLSQPDLQVSQKKSNDKITRSRKRRALSAATFDIATPPTHTTEDALSQPDLQVSQKKSNDKVTRSRKRRALSAATFDIAKLPTLPQLASIEVLRQDMPCLAEPRQDASCRTSTSVDQSNDNNTEKEAVTRDQHLIDVLLESYLSMNKSLATSPSNECADSKLVVNISVETPTITKTKHSLCSSSQSAKQTATVTHDTTAMASVTSATSCTQLLIDTANIKTKASPLQQRRTKQKKGFTSLQMQKIEKMINKKNASIAGMQKGRTVLVKSGGIVPEDGKKLRYHNTAIPTDADNNSYDAKQSTVILGSQTPTHTYSISVGKCVYNTPSLSVVDVSRYNSKPTSVRLLEMRRKAQTTAEQLHALAIVAQTNTISIRSALSSLAQGKLDVVKTQQRIFLVTNLLDINDKVTADIKKLATDGSIVIAQAQQHCEQYHRILTNHTMLARPLWSISTTEARDQVTGVSILQAVPSAARGGTLNPSFFYNPGCPPTFATPGPLLYR